MEQWNKWTWSAIVVLAVVAWTGALLISFAVADSQSSEEDLGSVVVIDQAVDWVACQAKLTRVIAPGRSLGTDERIRVRNECRMGSDAWVLCTDDELSKLSETELSVFQSSDAVQLAELCRERVGPTEEQP